MEKNSTRLRGERADGRIDPSTLGARSPTAGLNVIQCGPTNNTITMTNIRDWRYQQMYKIEIKIYYDRML